MSKKFDILVIDDEQVIIDSVVKLCSAEGLTVDSAIEATTGLDKLSKTNYCLIICDIMLPNLDGFQFLQLLTLRKINIPVIMTTGYSTVENAVKSLNNGAIDYLSKPFTVDELLSVVFRGLKYGRIQRSIAVAGSNSAQIDSSMFYVPCPVKYYRLGYSGWLYIEFDGSAKIGVTDLFLKTINTINRINLFNVEAEIIQGNTCAHFETDDDLIHQFLAPITGRIIKRNDLLFTKHTLIEKDPYFRGWLYTVIPSDLEYELKHLSSCSSNRF